MTTNNIDIKKILTKIAKEYEFSGPEALCQCDHVNIALPEIVDEIYSNVFGNGWCFDCDEPQIDATIRKDKNEVTICTTCNANTAMDLNTGKCVTCGSTERNGTGTYYKKCDSYDRDK